MDWPMDDEMTKQWKEISKEEEKITVRRGSGKGLPAEQVQSAPGLVVAQAPMRRRRRRPTRQELLRHGSQKCLRRW